MINPFKDTNWKPDAAGLRSFAISLIVGFPILAAVFSVIGLLRHDQIANWPLWMGGIGAAAGVLFYAVPVLARPFYILWYFFACCIGIVMSNVILGAIYYAVFTPIGWLLRLCGHDPMKRRLDPSASTYWRDVEPVRHPSSYFRQY